MQCAISGGSKLKKLTPLVVKGPVPAAKLMSGVMKMKDLATKKRPGKGYNPFDDDHKKKKKKRGGQADYGSSSSSSSGSGRGKRGAVMRFLRRFCGCLCPQPKHPNLTNPVVTHRKISRVASTESLAKEPSGVLEKPFYKVQHQPRPRRSSPKRCQVPQANVGNRFSSSFDNKNPFENCESDASNEMGTSTKPSWPVLPHVPTPRSLPSVPANSSLETHSASSSPMITQRFTHNLCESPKLGRTTKRPRPTHLSLVVHPAQRRRSSTPTPSGDSPASTPSTPKLHSGSWAHMRASLTSLIKVAAHSPKSSRPPAFYSQDDVESLSTQQEGSKDQDEEDVPDVTCLRPASGGVNDPARECFGSLTVRVLAKQGRWVKVVILALSGLPWVGGGGGLMLEVAIEPGGRPRWLVLPHAHGPNISLTLEATVKMPRDLKGKSKGLLKVGVWVCGRVWRHAALGYALMQPVETPSPSILPLLNHLELSENLGQVEVSLRCDYPDTLMTSGTGSSQGEVSLTLEVLKAKNLRAFHPGKLSKARHSKRKEQVEVVCRLGLWVEGQRITRETSTPVKLPVTQDPVVRTRCVFTLPKDNLQHAAIIVKVLYTSKWTNEDVIGRIQLGPFLYLGTSPEQQASQSPPPDYNTSITLSHWGLALKTQGPVTMWHLLQQ
ncbi:uncharacterized protein [Palaemon carinicauda]|uniref:uncharacterized protein isoform X1 n=1 Tax=Palaemon carinicauda TaxID=392227 RepID=UPI0035B6497C